MLFAAAIGSAGWVVARTGSTIAEQTALTDALVGAFLTAVVTSLPELVTSVAAVRRGALTPAVGGIIGGNAFDTIFLPFRTSPTGEARSTTPSPSNRSS